MSESTMDGQPDNTNTQTAGDSTAAQTGTQETSSASTQQTQQKPAIKFDEPQQAFVDALADRMFGKGFERGKAQVKELESKLAEATATIDTLNERLAGTGQQQQTGKQQSKAEETKEDEGAKSKKEPSPDLAMLMARFEELQSIATTLKQERDTLKQTVTDFETSSRESRVKDEFLKASADFNFFDPTEVLRLVREDIEWDDEYKAVVIKHPRTGQPRMSSSMEPMSLAEYLGEFVKRKPYLVRASAAEGGTGAGQSRRIETQTKSEVSAEAIDAMTPEQFEAFRNKLLARQR